MNLSIKIEGNEEASRRLAALGNSFDNLPTAMSEISRYVASFVAGEIFISQGGAIDQPWPRLSPRYEVIKARKFPGRPILVRTGLLIRSFKFSYTGSTARVYNDATTKDGERYLKFHQYGTRHMPARVVMAIDETRIINVVNILRFDIERKIAAV